jgi:hypothetical protein
VLLWAIVVVVVVLLLGDGDGGSDWVRLLDSDWIRLLDGDGGVDWVGLLDSDGGEDWVRLLDGDGGVDWVGLLDGDGGEDWVRLLDGDGGEDWVRLLDSDGGVDWVRLLDGLGDGNLRARKVLGDVDLISDGDGLPSWWNRMCWAFSISVMLGLRVCWEWRSYDGSSEESKSGEDGELHFDESCKVNLAKVSKRL